MSYNKNYNTRNSGRFNTPGKFVPAAEAPQQIPSYTTGPANNFPKQETQPPLPPPQPQNNYNTYPQEQLYDSNNDVVMKTETQQPEGTPGEGKPAWMKSKLDGVKKLSNRERRRRQNKHLRKLLSPKNALMTLNELMPGEQVLNNMKVEEVSPQFFAGVPKNNFMAEITLEGNAYKGYGESKNAAKNTAAEQAIRELLVKKLGSITQPAAGATGTTGTESIAESDEDEPFPMMQLASFALHKLFNDWHSGGLSVPSLRPPNANNPNAAAKPPLPSAPKPPKPPKQPHAVPVNAPSLHPCTLLGYLRPGLNYRELGVDGVNPPNLTYTAGVDVDGATYIGKAGSKKEARRQAAKAACEALYAIKFNPTPTDTVPVAAK